MGDTRNRDKPKSSGRDSPELRVVEVRYNSGPDAEDRLRRLISLFAGYAARDRPPSTSSGQAHAPEKDSPSEDQAGREG